MILKAYKAKLYQKIIKKALAKPRASVSDEKIKTVGVILNAEEFLDFERFLSFFKSVHLNSPKHKSVLFVPIKASEGSPWGITFNSKDFNFRGTTKHEDLKMFITTPYDLLISYYSADIEELQLVTALSMARFKVGISSTFEDLNDLTINVTPNDFDVFLNELKKYLKILNKL